MASPNYAERRRSHPKSRRQSALAVVVVLAIVSASLLLPVAHAQLLHPIDMLTLRSIKATMNDLPGGSFFSTWVFALRINPCQSFAGLQCVKVGSFNRVSSLSLGPPTAGLPGLSGSLPHSLGDLFYLQTLTISSGALRGSIPDSIGNLQNLRTFSLSPNYLSGPIPTSFANLHNLETLQIRKNLLEGQIPPGIGNLASLKVLVLSENRLYGPVPELSQTPLMHLDVRNNDLSGGLPPLPCSLQYLSVTRNQLSGPINAVEPLTSLSYLDLSYNEFTGSIPSAVFEFPLSFLLLNHNQLRGAVSVPAEVTISVVDLSHNKLQGTISPYLAGTQSLFLNNNLFVGTVPQDFANKMQEATLQSLYLQHNYLTNSGALANAALPPSVAVCLQYNCLVPPPQSLCPPNVDMPVSRPDYQCLKASSGSPGD
ncbi:uncharacterized protein [Physcomitrium patens]|uniref:Leucine-rich repeat-containing N-terminal plant-type domain-containing protein n=1 Tax=Physcomitrium patens TaxID=3218 RepID=A0A2K1IJR7_PHYPA|nr:probable inactive leucine-rich repeat receptor kinase XIAO [Physcomitrium patens]XP_024363121.1 probable inactive leucine-rich repeat receptor kinase XIAO [Physcomitrium patens]XP_024363122.1 probable inactive leucine-rich repeat receptor kinase XIAO [Physcomitrium patens]XP_024363123.1 probable inactive leucine-rich repeat receptor kinase XIAO [Physcomitrium patens]PNR29508.1 hypothetical protein PHYPA_028202 [Physcomitrium patens]|eukprot:XP_024363120.1 probable inactive leucine-rich repeat receptor kinase XIAO [Physcomitrella patens]